MKYTLLFAILALAGCQKPKATIQPKSPVPDITCHPGQDCTATLPLAVPLSVHPKIIGKPEPVCRWKLDDGSYLFRACPPNPKPAQLDESKEGATTGGCRETQDGIVCY